MFKTHMMTLVVFFFAVTSIAFAKDYNDSGWSDSSY